MQSGVPPTIVAQLSGHKNVGSLSRYTTASLRQQRMMSDILQNSNKRQKLDNQNQAQAEISYPNPVSLTDIMPIPAQPTTPQIQRNPPLNDIIPMPMSQPAPPVARLSRPPVPYMPYLSNTHQLTSGIFYGTNIGSIGTVNINISK